MKTALPGAPNRSLPRLTRVDAAKWMLANRRPERAMQMYGSWQGFHQNLADE
jgi:hypothetical protein